MNHETCYSAVIRRYPWGFHRRKRIDKASSHGIRSDWYVGNLETFKKMNFSIFCRQRSSMDGKKLAGNSPLINVATIQELKSSQSHGSQRQTSITLRFSAWPLIYKVRPLEMNLALKHFSLSVAKQWNPMANGVNRMTHHVMTLTSSPMKSENLFTLKP